mmetsp:Transcript_16509/g.51224  ORF Transcript_16509/g.51224 Transcript_16509/m.51224 type:complete len:231 (+) Transcript_16509:243-935(+)
MEGCHQRHPRAAAPAHHRRHGRGPDGQAPLGPCRRQRPQQRQRHGVVRGQPARHRQLPALEQRERRAGARDEHDDLHARRAQHGHRQGRRRRRSARVGPRHHVQEDDPQRPRGPRLRPDSSRRRREHARVGRCRQGHLHLGRQEAVQADRQARRAHVHGQPAHFLGAPARVRRRRGRRPHVEPRDEDRHRELRGPPVEHHLAPLGDALHVRGRRAQEGQVAEQLAPRVVA